MSDIKLIAVDMDGTFLRNDMSYDKEKFKSLYSKMKNKNIKFVIASGNQYYQLKSFFGDIQDELTYISENGGLIIEKGNEVDSVSIPKKKVLKVINLLNKYKDIKIAVNCKNFSYVLKNDDEFYNLVSLYYYRLKKIDKFEDIEDQFLKLSVVTPENTASNVKNEMYDLIKEYMIPTVSGHNSVDLIYPGRNKGYGIKFLQERWNILPSESMAFGDSGNDIEMLKQVKYSFAMENAIEELKHVSSYTAPDNNNDGVLKVIEKYI